MLMSASMLFVLGLRAGVGGGSGGLKQLKKKGDLK